MASVGCCSMATKGGSGGNRYWMRNNSLNDEIILHTCEILNLVWNRIGSDKQSIFVFFL